MEKNKELMAKIKLTEPLFDQNEKNNLLDTIKSGWITQGIMVSRFEKQFAKTHKVKHAIAVNSCTSALHLILMSLDISKGDEIIVPSYTWISTANVVEHLNAKLILVDVDLNTNNICIKDLKRKLSKNTKIIIAVHLFGLCSNITQIKKLTKNKIKIIEDAACATGSKLGKIFAGNLGLAGAFSFHPRKIITTGEGGMVTTNNTKIANKILELRNHGAKMHIENSKFVKKDFNPSFMSEFNIPGHNFRMTDIQGSIGIAQLKKLNIIINFRNKFAKYYISKLKKISWIKVPHVEQNSLHSWQAFVICIDNKIAPFSRDKIMKILLEKNIFTRPGTHAVHMQNYYKKKYNFKMKQFPNSYYLSLNSIALPLHNKMLKKDFDYIISVLINLEN